MLCLHGMPPKRGVQKYNKSQCVNQLLRKKRIMSQYWNNKVCTLLSQNQHYLFRTFHHIEIICTHLQLLQDTLELVKKSFSLDSTVYIKVSLFTYYPCFTSCSCFHCKESEKLCYKYIFKQVNFIKSYKNNKKEKIQTRAGSVT